MKRGITNPAIAVFISLVTLLLVPYRAHAEQPRIMPGRYVTEGGWGNMTIAMNKDGNLAFEISAIGANAHSCSLEGIIKEGKATLEALEDNKPCIVTFHPRGNDIEVTDNEGVCRHYCGVRAGFTGLYLKPAPGCDGPAIQKSRKQFQRLYDRKAYARARAVLEPVFKDCSRYIHWMELAWIRNDLAITQYKLGEYEECLRILKPLEEDAMKTDEELSDSYPPADAVMVMPIALATRTNLNLCKKKK